MRAMIWLRNDLRIYDNKALFHASRDCRDGLIAVYFIDPALNTNTPSAQRKKNILLRQLKSLRDALAPLKIALLVETTPHYAIAETINKLMSTYDCQALYFNKRYEWLNRQQDSRITRILADQKYHVFSFDDQLVATPGQLLNPKNQPITHFNVFKKAWLAWLPRFGTLQSLTLPELQVVYLEPKTTSSILDNVSAQDPKCIFPDSEQSAQQALKQFIHEKLPTLAEEYRHPQLDRLDLLSYNLNGILSPRQLIRTILETDNLKITESIDLLLNDLIQREFYYHIMYHFPHVCEGYPFLSECAHIPWENEEHLLAAWKNGNTGFPLIDAAMRSLKQTGWLHPHLQQVCAMFFCKILFLNWQVGESYFRESFTINEFAPLNGLWQWCSSTGAEASIYSRIPNPIKQSELIDPTGQFIRQYCPELSALDNHVIHSPHDRALRLVATTGYPKPIIDYTTTRKKSIDFFKKLNKKNKPLPALAGDLEIS